MDSRCIHTGAGVFDQFGAGGDRDASGFSASDEDKSCCDMFC